MRDLTVTKHGGGLASALLGGVLAVTALGAGAGAMYFLNQYFGQNSESSEVKTDIYDFKVKMKVLPEKE